MTNDGGRLQRFAPWALSVGLLGVAVAGNLASTVDRLTRSGQPVALFTPLLDEFTSAAIWLAVLPLIVTAFRLASPPRAPWIAAPPLHLAFAAIVSLTHYALTRLLRAVILALLDGGFRFHFAWGDYAVDLYKDVLSYLLFGLIFIGARQLLAARSQARDGAETQTPEPAVVIEVRDGAQTTYLPAAQILWVEAAGNYVELHATGGRTILMRATLASLADRLEGAGFLRIHRSRLVSPAVVATVENLPSGDTALVLTDGARILASRRYRPALADALATRVQARAAG